MEREYLLWAVVSPDVLNYGDKSGRLGVCLARVNSMREYAVWNCVIGEDGQIFNTGYGFYVQDDEPMSIAVEEYLRRVRQQSQIRILGR